ncbi:hypothetical protein D3C72_2263400 [compost metagenome]
MRVRRAPNCLVSFHGSALPLPMAIRRRSMERGIVINGRLDAGLHHEAISAMLFISSAGITIRAIRRTALTGPMLTACISLTIPVTAAIRVVSGAATQPR